MDVLHAVAAELGHHGHRRVVGVERLDHRREAFDRRPDRGVVPLLVPLHLIAEPPHEQGGVIFILEDDLASLLLLLRDLIGVVVVEPVPPMAEPDAQGDGQPAFLGLVQDGAGLLDAPCPDRVAADLGQELQRPVAADTLDEVGAAAANQLVTAVLPRQDADGRGPVGHRQAAAERENRGETERSSDHGRGSEAGGTVRRSERT